MSRPRPRTNRLSELSRRSIIRWTTCSLVIICLFHPAIKFHYNRHSREQLDTPFLQHEDQELSSLSFNAPAPTNKFGILLRPVIQRDIHGRDGSLELVQSDKTTGEVVTRSDCPLIRCEDNNSEHGYVAEVEKYEDADVVVDNDDASFNIIIRETPQLAATSALQPMHRSATEQSSRVHILASRWAELFKSGQCLYRNIQDRTKCMEKENLHMLIWVALGVTVFCAVLLLFLRCLSCIRRKGAVSRDLSQIMTEQKRSTAPKIQNIVPLHLAFRVDGEAEESGNQLANKKIRPATGKGKQVDEEAAAEAIECRSLDGATDGWTSWFAKKNHQATLTSKPTPRVRLPRIPSLTLPKPCLATVRKASGLDFYEELEDDEERLGLNYRNYSKRGTVIRWHN